jgi:beta-galactosidase
MLSTDRSLSRTDRPGHHNHEAGRLQSRSHGRSFLEFVRAVQGKFDFEWFDKVMDKMQASRIRVIVDIPGLPAPIWLHRTYPGVDLVNQKWGAIPIGRALHG